MFDINDKSMNQTPRLSFSCQDCVPPLINIRISKFIQNQTVQNLTNFLRNSIHIYPHQISKTNKNIYNMRKTIIDTAEN